MQEIMVHCKKCSNKVPASSLRLDLDLKLMACPDCIKNKHVHKEIEKNVFHKEDIKESPEAQKTKIAHKCTSCGYKFKIDIETKKPKSCPYCNARVMSF